MSKLFNFRVLEFEKFEIPNPIGFRHIKVSTLLKVWNFEPSKYRDSCRTRQNFQISDLGEVNGYSVNMLPLTREKYMIATCWLDVSTSAGGGGGRQFFRPGLLLSLSTTFNSPCNRTRDRVNVKIKLDLAPALARLKLSHPAGPS